MDPVKNVVAQNDVDASDYSNFPQAWDTATLQIVAAMFRKGFRRKIPQGALAGRDMGRRGCAGQLISSAWKRKAV
jgi:hypothetical protein